MQEILLRGRAAFEHRAWARALRILAKADRASLLTPPDLELLASAAYMRNRVDEQVKYLGRAHDAHLEAGEAMRAARCAFWAGVSLATSGKASHATGWFARARRLLQRKRDCVERGYLQIPALLSCAAAGRWRRTAAIAYRAMQIAERFGDQDLFALAAHERAHALVRLGHVERGLSLLDEVMVLVVPGKMSPIVTGLVYCSAIAYCQALFQPGRAQAWTEALAGWCDEQPEMLAHAGQCLVHRAEILQMRGSWRKALSEAREAAARFAEIRAVRAAGRALYRQAEIRRLQGNLAQAESAYRKANRLGCDVQPGLALLRLAQGRTAAAANAIRRALAEASDALERANLLPPAVEILLESGQLDEARACCDELEACAKRCASELLDAAVRECRGVVALAHGDVTDALASLRRAFETWHALQAPYEAARVRRMLGRACRALGDEETALLEFDAARGEFARLGARTDAQRSRALMQTRPAAHRLSVRELEVLRHVAAGKSNKGIARDLGLSGRTIDRHLSNIFDKLGVSSRSAATAYAYRARLV